MYISVAKKYWAHMHPPLESIYLAASVVSTDTTVTNGPRR